jgi:hypothetical protein
MGIGGWSLSGKKAGTSKSGFPTVPSLQLDHPPLAEDQSVCALHSRRERLSQKEDGRLSDFWTVGPTVAMLGLRAMGFNAREAERLVSMKLRYLRGDFRQPTLEEKRLRFARWLVEHGRLSDGQPASDVNEQATLKLPSPR